MSIFPTTTSPDPDHFTAAADKYIGPLAASSIKTVVKEITQQEQVRQDKLASLPPLDEILSLHDFEALAKETMSDKAWAYYSSGADDEITMVCLGCGV
jgi:L-lactate dehydrogenase (cytochrome)